MGARSYNYRNWSALGAAAAALPMLLFAVGGMALLSQAGGNAPPVITLFFLAIGLLGGCWLLGCLATWMNERIEVSPDELVWFNRFNIAKVRCLISGITPGSLTSTTSGESNYGSYKKIPRRWKLETESGPIQFRSSINDCHELLAQLEQLGAVDGVGPRASAGYHLIGNYHCFILVAFIVFLPLLAFGLCFPVEAEITGQTLNAQNGNPASSGMIFGLISIIVALFLGFVGLVLMFKNVEVTLTGDSIAYRDWLGRYRVQCKARDVVPGGYSEKTYYQNNGATTYYRIETTMGLIKFNSGLNNADILAEQFKAMAQGRPAAGSTDKESPSTSAWTNDPLAESDPGNLPIK